jgi:hypothetical protein
MVASTPIALQLKTTTRPERIEIIASAPDIPANKWDLWIFPDVHFNFDSTVRRLDALPFMPIESQPDDVEKGYSRGYGLPVRNWQPAMPDPNIRAPALVAWNGQSPPPTDMHVLLTHRLTDQIVDWLADGGNVILLASKANGALGTSYEWLFGQSPLIIEQGPVQQGDSEWIIDLLGYDLTRHYARVIPVETLGITDSVDPLIRLVYTHDQRRVKFFDMLFHTRVGDGRLMVSSLDHSEAPGQYLLHRMINHMQQAADSPIAKLDSTLLRNLISN